MGTRSPLRSILDPLVFQLEPLSLTYLNRSDKEDYYRLPLVSPYNILIDFTNLKSLSMFKEALYYPKDEVTVTSITALPSNTHRLQIQHPTMDCLEVVNTDFQDGCAYTNSLNKLVLQ